MPNINEYPSVLGLFDNYKKVIDELIKKNTISNDYTDRYDRIIYILCKLLNFEINFDFERSSIPKKWVSDQLELQSNSLQD